MSAPRKYPLELEERARRLCLDAREDASTRRGAIARIAKQLGIHPEALRGWIRETERGEAPSVPTSVAGTQVSPQRRRIVELEAELREVKRANLVLGQAATFFWAQLDRQHR